MTADNLELAKKMAKRSYLIMTSKSETTDGQPIYHARTIEIEGCIGQGDTPEQAVLDLRDALVDYIEGLLEDGLEVPELTPLVRTVGTGTSTSIISTPITLNRRGISQRIQQKPIEQTPDQYILKVPVHT
jgi:predicted RNase H-like HicB family nuclease